MTLINPMEIYKMVVEWAMKHRENMVLIFMNVVETQVETNETR